MRWCRTRCPRPRCIRAPGAGDAMLLPGRRVGASARHPPRGCRSLGLPRRPRTQDGAHAAPTSVHGTIGRPGSQHDDGLSPRLPGGLRRAGVAAMLQGTRCMWHAAVVPSLLFPGPRQTARLRSSNPTPAVSRASSRSDAGAEAVGVGSSALFGGAAGPGHGHGLACPRRRRQAPTRDSAPTPRRGPGVALGAYGLPSTHHAPLTYQPARATERPP